MKSTDLAIVPSLARVMVLNGTPLEADDRDTEHTQERASNRSHCSRRRRLTAGVFFCAVGIVLVALAAQHPQGGHNNNKTKNNMYWDEAAGEWSSRAPTHACTSAADEALRVGGQGAGAVHYDGCPALAAALKSYRCSPWRCCRHWEPQHCHCETARQDRELLLALSVAVVLRNF